MNPGIEYQLDYVMLIPHQLFSHHILQDDQYIDVKQLVITLNALRLLVYDASYNISETTCKEYPLKSDVMSYYTSNGVCRMPIVVTSDDYCLDGRHRVSYRKQTADIFCPAYIAPSDYVIKFIKQY